MKIFLPRPTAIIATFAVLYSLGHAQTPREVVYKKADGDDLKLFIYREASNPSPTPALIYVPGSGYRDLALEEPLTSPALKPLIDSPVAKGTFSLVVVSHREAGKSTAMGTMVGDVQDALRYVSSNAQTLGINQAALVVSGHESGAHLALMAVNARGGLYGDLPGEVPEVCAVVAFAPLLDFEALAERLEEAAYSEEIAADIGLSTREARKRVRQISYAFDGRIAEAREAYRMGSPVNYLQKSSPETVILFGENDSLSGQSAAFIERAGEVGANVQRIDVPGQDRNLLDAALPADIQSRLERLLARCLGR